MTLLRQTYHSLIYLVNIFPLARTTRLLAD
jgi:hypothetical protein